MICQKGAKIQPATLGKFTDKYLVLSYMVGTKSQPPPPPPPPPPPLLNKKAGCLGLVAPYLLPACLVGAKGGGEGVKNEKVQG